MTSTTRPSVRRRPPTRYVVVGVLAVLAVLAALVGPAVYGLINGASAKDKIAADPPPTLFATSVADRVETLVVPQQARAAALLTPWWQQHGTKADDSAFRTWLEDTFPAPPSRAARMKEMAELVRLDRARTAAGITAATWLETHGKKDVWKLAVHDADEYLPGSEADGLKQAEKDALSMTKTVADDLGTTFGAPAPYLIRPSLRTDKPATPGTVCPCSYPSRHASASAASRTLLAHVMPQRDGEYRWWQDQIDYSRLYMAGHFASDIAGGTLLGDMIGDYFLVTRESTSPQALPGARR